MRSHEITAGCARQFELSFEADDELVTGLKRAVAQTGIRIGEVVLPLPGRLSDVTYEHGDAASDRPLRVAHDVELEALSGCVWAVGSVTGSDLGATLRLDGGRTLGRMVAAHVGRRLTVVVSERGSCAERGDAEAASLGARVTHPALIPYSAARRRPLLGGAGG